MPESIDELVRAGADLIQYPGIGQAIAGAIQEIVLTGTLEQLERLRSQSSPELRDINNYPQLDPRRVLRIYKKLKISSIDSLKKELESGEIERVFGPRMTLHVRRGLSETQAMLLYKAETLRESVEEFLVGKCKVRRAEVVGDFRRRVEVIDELAFLVDIDDFSSMVSRLERYGGGTPLLSSSSSEALFALSAGISLRIHNASLDDWGAAMIATTGSGEHLRKLSVVTENLQTLRRSGAATEAAVYELAGLDFIEPELREGFDEIERARQHDLPSLISQSDLRGELHAHSLSSDGTASIEEMARAAREQGYEYIGMTDHSQSLKIANGVSAEDLWKQIRFIDRLNGTLQRFQILKSSEVDILADGSLDYPDELLKELDYTVCSIHSRFGLGKADQTERIMRAMDNRYFNILGHATGRLLLKRPGYDIEMDRLIVHARKNGCFFEINSSPDRLDLSAEYVREAVKMGMKFAISTDAHSTGEFYNRRYGIDQARRAGLEKNSVLNCLPWQELRSVFAR